MEQKWEEVEKILSWGEMRLGVYRYHCIEHRGINDYGRSISMITLETKEQGVKMYYAPSSLYWDLNAGVFENLLNLRREKKIANLRKEIFFC